MLYTDPSASEPGSLGSTHTSRCSCPRMRKFTKMREERWRERIEKDYHQLGPIYWLETSLRGFSLFLSEAHQGSEPTFLMMTTDRYNLPILKPSPHCQTELKVGLSIQLVQLHFKINTTIIMTTLIIPLSLECPISTQSPLLAYTRYTECRMDLSAHLQVLYVASVCQQFGQSILFLLSHWTDWMSVSGGWDCICSCCVDFR